MILKINLKIYNINDTYYISLNYVREFNMGLFDRIKNTNLCREIEIENSFKDRELNMIKYSSISEKDVLIYLKRLHELSRTFDILYKGKTTDSKFKTKFINKFLGITTDTFNPYIKIYTKSKLDINILVNDIKSILIFYGDIIISIFGKYHSLLKSIDAHLIDNIFSKKDANVIRVVKPILNLVFLLQSVDLIRNVNSHKSYYKYMSLTHIHKSLPIQIKPSVSYILDEVNKYVDTDYKGFGFTNKNIYCNTNGYGNYYENKLVHSKIIRSDIIPKRYLNLGGIFKNNLINIKLYNDSIFSKLYYFNF